MPYLFFDLQKYEVTLEKGVVFGLVSSADVGAGETPLVNTMMTTLSVGGDMYFMLPAVMFESCPHTTHTAKLFNLHLSPQIFLHNLHNGYLVLHRKMDGKRFSSSIYQPKSR